ncbi:MAG: AAA family ATPase [Elusimicrobiota bacterium]
MIKTFSIKNFKCFEEINVKPLERINLITGKNNMGKTTLLEAIWLHEGAHNASFAFRIEQFRGITRFDHKDFLSDLFIKFKSDKEILLEAEYQDGKTLSLKVTQQESKQPRPIIEGPEIQGTTNIVSPKILFEGIENGVTVCNSEIYIALDQGNLKPFSSANNQLIRPTAIFVSTGVSKEIKNKTDAVRFAAQVRMKRKNEIVEALKAIDDRLQGLDLDKRGDENFVCGDIGYDRMLPLSLMGEGMERYLSLVLSVLTAENGTVLIDEIENGFHYSVCGKVWSNLANLARKYNVQIIATTHSHECIAAAHESFKQEREYDFILHRLDRVGEKIEDITYDKDTLEASLKSDMEIR